MNDYRAVTPRFVFVAGLHRTGTSLLARILGSHPEISAIEDAPVPENEGCYLQGAIAHTARDGRPGHFATDPLQHHTEGSRFDTLETKQRLMSDWSPWFDASKPWWIEKSPVNLTRMRLYQQLFPTSQYIVILRHPQVMAAALAKWVEAPPAALIRYALEAYELVLGDLPFLHAAMLLRYEDLVARPDAVRKAAFAFLGLKDRDPQIRVRNGNDDYHVEAEIDPALSRRMERWGYLPGGGCASFEAPIRHPLRSVSEAVQGHLAG